MLRARLLFPILCLTVGIAVAVPPVASLRILPKSVTLHQSNGGTLAVALTVVRDQSSLPVDFAPDVGAAPCVADFDKLPVWEALERIAEKSGTRITLRDHGRKITLAKRVGSADIASVDGPFRVVLRQIRAVTDFESGRSFTELTLEIHWEPRIPVFRIDGQPQIEASVDGQERSLRSEPIRTKTPVTGSSFTTTVQLPMIPRSAKMLTTVSGTITVTAAERMMRVAVPLAKLPAKVEQDGVTVTVPRAETIEDRYEVSVELTYPPETPEFESFESFASENQAELTDATKLRRVSTLDAEVSSNGRRVSAVYRFPKNGGTTLEYTTPSPLREFAVHFTWKDVPLP